MVLDKLDTSREELVDKLLYDKRVFYWKLRQVGSSTILITHIIKELQLGKDILVVSPSIDLSLSFMQLVTRYVVENNIKNTIYSTRNTLEVSSKSKKGTLFCKQESPGSRGRTYDIVILSEVTFFKNFYHSFQSLVLCAKNQIIIEASIPENLTDIFNIYDAWG
jgi:hypothetical protein